MEQHGDRVTHGLTNLAYHIGFKFLVRWALPNMCFSTLCTRMWALFDSPSLVQNWSHKRGLPYAYATRGLPDSLPPPLAENWCCIELPEGSPTRMRHGTFRFPSRIGVAVIKEVFKWDKILVVMNSLMRERLL